MIKSCAISYFLVLKNLFFCHWLIISCGKEIYKIMHIWILRNFILIIRLYIDFMKSRRKIDVSRCVIVGGGRRRSFVLIYYIISFFFSKYMSTRFILFLLISDQFALCLRIETVRKKSKVDARDCNYDWKRCCRTDGRDNGSEAGGSRQWGWWADAGIGSSRCGDGTDRWRHWRWTHETATGNTIADYRLSTHASGQLSIHNIT